MLSTFYFFYKAHQKFRADYTVRQRRVKLRVTNTALITESLISRSDLLFRLLINIHEHGCSSINEN